MNVLIKKDNRICSSWGYILPIKDNIYNSSLTKEKRKMTNINGIQKMVVGSKEYELIQKMMGDRNGSKVEDETTLFNTMQYYEMTNCSDNWSTDAQELSIEELIELWKDFDKEDTSFAQDFDTFDAYLATYKKDEPEPPEEDEDIVRPYIPDPDLSDDDKNRLKDFDYMRANDIHAKLDQEGDYELLLEYVRQREGTSFLVPSDYNEDGTVNDKGKAKEEEMIAKLAELDTADNTIGTVLKDFLEAYGVEEVKGEGTNGVLPDVSGVVKDLATGTSSELAIGENLYLVTNNGDANNQLAYEVKTNEKGEKYIEMQGDNWRIQDISGELQDDLIQIIGNNNELDLGLGDDIAHLIGDGNRALMGNGDDKVYIEGDENFTDMWRGDDQMFNINSDKTTGIGFTGDDNFYTKGDNVLVNGESNTPVGDGLYEDGITTDYDIENSLDKPDWFPDPDSGDDDPSPGDEKFEEDEDTIIEFNGVRYEVYKKFGADATDKIVYYKAEDGRTVFEADGWNITVIDSMNDTGDKNYANVVIEGNRNSYFGSNDEDTIEIKGDDNYIHGDTSDTMGSNDKIVITSGTGNYVYGEEGVDSINTSVEGNFFNQAILDIEEVNGEDQDLTPPSKPSAWVSVDNPNESQIAQMELAKEAFGLPQDSTVKGLKQNGDLLGMTIDGMAYISETNDDGTVASITQKSSTETLAKVEYEYKDGEVSKTTMTDYVNNKTIVTNPDGSRTETTYDDVTAKIPKVLSVISYDAEGNIISQSDTDKGANTVTESTEDGGKLDTVYDDVSSTNRKPVTQTKTDAEGNVVYTKEFDYANNTTTTINADGTKLLSIYYNLTNGESTIQSTEHYDAEGNLTATDTYKYGKLDMTFKEGDIMTVDEFYEALDLNKNSEITADEVIQVFNKTSNPVLKAILSNFTDGETVTLAFQIAATTTGRPDYEKGNNGITKGGADVNQIAEDGNITSGKLAELQNNAAYATLVGGDVNYVWSVTGNQTHLASTNPAYPVTDEGSLHQYTMTLLNENGGTNVNRDDLAAYGITTTEDFENRELFEKIREGSDLVEELDKMDGDANITKTGVPDTVFGKPQSGTPGRTGSISAQNLLDMYNSCVSGANKDQAWAENMKTLCVNSGYIVVDDGVAKIANGFTNLTKISAVELFKKALEAVGYPNLDKMKGEEEE